MQKKAPVRVLIVGGGIAGLILAQLLERSDRFSVEIIERCPGWKSLGGGITLTLNGMKLLYDIGIGKTVEDRGVTIKRIDVTNSRDGLLSSFNLEPYENAFAKTLTILRADLHDILREGLTRTSVFFNTTFIKISEEETQSLVVFSDGRSGRYDLIVGCDGMYSSLRQSFFADSRLRYSGYVCWRFVCDANDIDYSGDCLKEMWGKGKRFGIVPVNGNRIHNFACINSGTPRKFEGISIQEFKLLFAEFRGPVPEILGSLKNDDKMIFNKLEDVYVDNWVKGNMVLVGDAAHGMTPNLTQGASMAIEDAVCLYKALETGNETVTSLAAFFEARKRRVHSVQRRSTLLGKIAQLQSPVLSRIRDYGWKNIPDKWIQKDFENLLIRKDISWPEIQV
jgi:2-polyprenyl-6-methoxyphenol hydroxylase-like FAD-dependent oxidoreductase